MRELLCTVLLLLGPATSISWPGADPTMPGCTGGIAPEPRNGVIVGPGTVDARVEAVPGGIYDLSVWSGSTRPGPATATGLQFLDPTGAQTGRTYARRPLTEKLKRYNSYGMIAPQNAAIVRFFATTNTEIHWDCVFLRVSAYALELEQAADELKITVRNTGSLPLAGLRLSVQGCDDEDPTPFDLEDHVVRTCTGTAPATAGVSGALYWNGALPDRSVGLGSGIGDQPQHTGRR